MLYNGTQEELTLIQIATSRNLCILKLFTLSDLPEVLQHFLQDGGDKESCSNLITYVWNIVLFEIGKD